MRLRGSKVSASPAQSGYLVDVFPNYLPLLVILLLHKNFWKALIVSYELCKKENAQKAISVLLSVLLGYVSVPVFVIFKVPYE